MIVRGGDKCSSERFALAAAARAGSAVSVGLKGSLRGAPIVPATRADRVSELVERYADMDLGVVDASVIAVAERLGVTTIATIDETDFRVVRPRHCDAFELIP